MEAHQQQRAASPPPPPPPPPPPQQGGGGGGGGGGFSAIFTVFLSFIIISCLALVPSSSALKNSLSVIHEVPEGHVGVYWRGGALLKTITEPGFHLKMPLITHFEPIQVTLQTDLVRDIPCGTKGGVMINFEKIEVVNRLRKSFVYQTLHDYGVQYDNTWIYDMIYHEINQFCSARSLQQVYIDMFDQIDEKMKDDLQSECTRYAPGIEIISVRVTKPTIPESIRWIYEQMEEERPKSYSEMKSLLQTMKMNSLLQTMDAHQQQRAASPPPPPPPPPSPSQQGGGGGGGFSAIFTVFLSFIKISCLRTIRLRYFLLLKMKEVFSPINNAIGETAAREVLVNYVVKPAVTKLGWEILQHFFVRGQNSAIMVVLFVLLVLVLFYDSYKRASKDSLSGKNY